jgi:hypothetical protein
MVKKNDKLRKSDIVKINKKFLESLENYRKLLNILGGDMPIECLCLPKKSEKILISYGFLRIYDLINTDLSEVKGFSDVAMRDLTSRLDQFFSMS